MTSSKTQGEAEVNKRKEREEINELLSKRLQQATVALVKASNALPKMGDGFELYSTYPLYYKCTKDQRIKIATAMKNLLANSGCKVRIPVDGPEDMDKIIFVNDLLVERASMALDEHQKRLAQNYAAKRLSCGAETVPGAVVTRTAGPTLSDAMPKVQGFQDGLGRYAQLGRRSEESTKATADSTRDLSITQQEMEEFNTDGYLDLLHPGSNFNNRQLAALAKLWKWRWVTSRKNSKSINYVLPDNMMLSLAEVLPRDMQGITAICHPLPPFVQHDLPLLHKMISTARELKLDASTGGATHAEMSTPKMQGVPQMGTANSSLRLSVGEQLDRIASTKKIVCVRKRRNSEDSLIIARSLARAKSTASVTVVEECSKDEENTRESKLKKIYSTISQWATPYESYLLAKRIDEEDRPKYERGHDS